MIKKILAISVVLLSPIFVSAAELYPAPSYNSGIAITDVSLIKVGPKSYMVPEQPVTAMIPADSVLVGVGVRAGSKTVTTVHLMYRRLLGGGNFGAIETEKFGSKPSHALEVEWVETSKNIAIVGLEFRIDKHDDFTTMNVYYRTFDGSGNLGQTVKRISTGSKPDYNKMEAIYLPNTSGDRVITGLGLVNHDEDVDSMWIYEGVIGTVPPVIVHPPVEIDLNFPDTWWRNETGDLSHERATHVQTVSWNTVNAVKCRYRAKDADQWTAWTDTNSEFDFTIMNGVGIERLNFSVECENASGNSYIASQTYVVLPDPHTGASTTVPSDPFIGLSSAICNGCGPNTSMIIAEVANASSCTFSTIVYTGSGSVETFSSPLSVSLTPTVNRHEIVVAVISAAQTATVSCTGSSATRTVSIPVGGIPVP